MLLITGGLGFIGSNFILQHFAQSDEPIVNLDLMTYAANRENLSSIENQSNYTLVEGDIADSQLLAQLLREHQPRAIINFAAESHVDRSIHSPKPFLDTNVTGVGNLLEQAYSFWEAQEEQKKAAFRFLHISTDEVFGSLGFDDPPFVEESPYQPSSPYSATKAASDHLVRVYHTTYGLPILITNCGNNYGPRQCLEKLIPLTVANASNMVSIPVYGEGKNERNWIHVDDHCRALQLVLERGEIGETYLVGVERSSSNLHIVELICDLLDELKPADHSRRELITFVEDRLGHDLRYDIDSSKLSTQLGWSPQVDLYEGLRQTIAWYQANDQWMAAAQNEEHRKWIAHQYTNSLAGKE